MERGPHTETRRLASWPATGSQSLDADGSDVRPLHHTCCRLSLDSIRKSQSEIRNILLEHSARLDKVIYGTRSLRSSHPHIRVPISVISRASSIRLSKTDDGSSLGSTVEFDFDDVVVNSKAYRRTLRAAHQTKKGHPV